MQRHESDGDKLDILADRTEETTCTAATKETGNERDSAKITMSVLGVNDNVYHRAYKPSVSNSRSMPDPGLMVSPRILY